MKGFVFVTLLALVIVQSVYCEDSTESDIEIDGCDSCKAEIHGVRETIIDRLLSEPEADDEKLSNVCDMMHEEFRAVCYTVIEKHGLDLLKSLNDERVTFICGMLQQCSLSPLFQMDESDLKYSPELAPAVEEFQTNLGGLVCTICDGAMVMVKRFLSSPNSQKYALRLLKGVCKILPGGIGATCTRLVAEYGPMIIRLAAHTLSPEVCKTFGLCPRAFDEGNGKRLCRVCTFFAGIVHDTLHDPYINRRYRLFGRSLCNIVHINTNRCHGLLTRIYNEYIKYAERYFKKSKALNTVCLDFCKQHQLLETLHITK